MADFIEAQKSGPGDNLTLGEAMERYRRGVDELRKIAGEEVPETSEEGSRRVISVPRYYPKFDDPGKWHRWDDSNEAWAWKAERDYFEDCMLTAAARFYARVRDWSLVPHLLVAAGWESSFDEEHAEEFVEENRDRILARLQEIE